MTDFEGYGKKKKRDCRERIVKTSETDRKSWSKCVGFSLKKHYF